MHCVIVGFGIGDRPGKRLFEYAEVDGEPHELAASNINPYLVDGPNVVLPSRAPTPAGLPLMTKGSQPTDGGHLLLDDASRIELLATEPAAEPWVRRYLGAEELLHGTPRWCLWLKGADPRTLRSLPKVMERVQAVRQVRLASPTAAVREAAEAPTLFTQDRQPATTYLAVPAHTSELRRFIPIAFLGPETVASNALRICPGATLFHFGVVMSTMHNAWVRYTCGRIKSDLRYEPNVFNTFPWPSVDVSQRRAIEAAAQGVLDARASFPGNSLADLYDELAMPPTLRKAHQRLDVAVDAAYLHPGKKGFGSDSERVAHLFERYRAMNSLLPAEPPVRKAAARKRRSTPSAA